MLEKKPKDNVQFIVKIGGSITEKGSINQIKKLTETISEVFRLSPNFLIIPGGGIFAEHIREAQSKFQFSDEIAHWMAIQAMGQQALLLNFYLPNSEVIYDFSRDSLNDFLLNNPSKVPILDVFQYMQKHSKLEQSWDITSDAIAVDIARFLDLSDIIFIKDVDGVVLDNKLQNKITINNLQLLNNGPLDKKTPKLLKENNIKATIINGFHPERFKELVINKSIVICSEIIIE